VADLKRANDDRVFKQFKKSETERAMNK